jgi:carboxypeptidase C (cathepsin A)
LTRIQFQLSPVFYVSVLSIACCSLSQQFSPPVSYDAVLKSPINPNITISYKEPELGTCTTAFTSQKQYTGYINLPPSTLEPYQQNHPINTFFWFFEARNNTRTAPLTIWLNGGPGASSMRGLFREIGPCEVVQFQNGTYGTQFNEWGWDRSSNLLFIDQPTQVGFSYDQTHNVSVDSLKDHNVTPPAALPKGTPAWAYVNGTLASGNLNHIQNPTGIAARAVWHFLQGFLSAFPQYNPGQHLNQATVDPTGVNLFAESYGGQYGPVFADFFEDQNDRRRTGAIPANKTLEIRLASLGIVNGIVDELIQVPSTVSFAHNNSYGVRGLSSTQHRQLLYEFELPGGCQDLASQCNKEVVAQSHEGENVDEETEKLCQKAKAACWKIQWPALETIGRSPYDIRASKANSFPNYAYLEYLNSEDVLKSIGAKVNFTENTPAVNDAFGYSES